MDGRQQSAFAVEPEAASRPSYDAFNAQADLQREVFFCANAKLATLMAAGGAKIQRPSCMTNSTASASRVLVILDPNYGDRLRDVWPGRAVWITMSIANEPVVRSFWANHPKLDHLTGITGLRFDPLVAAEDRFISGLDAIDLHHGPYSTSNPYSELEVVGIQPTSAVREAMTQLGFTQFEERPDGFVARRSQPGAAREVP
jgi:hypothetical protein